MEVGRFNETAASVAGIRFILDLGMKRFANIILSVVLLSAIFSASLSAQDWIRTGTGLGVEKIRLAVPDFKAAANDPETKRLTTTFSVTLWNDLQAAGIFDMVSPSFYPLSNSGSAARRQPRPVGRSSAQRQHARLRQCRHRKPDRWPCKVGCLT